MEKYWVIATIHTIGGCHNYVSKKKMTEAEIDNLRNKYPRIVVDVPEFNVEMDADVICGIIRTTATREETVKLCKEMNMTGGSFSSWFSQVQEEEDETT